MVCAAVLIWILVVNVWLCPSSAGSKIVWLFCPSNSPIDLNTLLSDCQQIVRHINADWQLEINNSSGCCCDEQAVSSTAETVEALQRESDTLAVVSSMPTALCQFIGHRIKKPVISPSCPQKFSQGEPVIGLAPSHDVTAASILEIFKHLRWKTISIITSELGWWPRLSLRIEAVLKGSGVTVRHHLVLSPDSSLSHITESLQSFKQAPSRTVIVCMPMGSSIAQKVVDTLDKLQVVSLPATSVMFFSVDYPMNDRSTVALIGSMSFGLRKATLLLTSSCVSSHSDRYNSSYSESQQAYLNYLCLLRTSLIALNQTMNNSTDYKESAFTHQRHILFDWIDANEKYPNNNSEIHSKQNMTLAYSNSTGKWRALILLDWQKSVPINSNGRKVQLRVEPLVLRSREWPRLKQQMASMIAPSNTDDLTFCDEDICIDANGYSFLPKGVHFVSVIVYSLLSVILLIFVVALARRQYLKKQMSKGPCKILLTPADFVFPHAPDSRRVDEGIETMLCCWLQQLQEFGGPEVDKPDLLKGSVGSLHSVHSHNKPVICDPRARYNGDLVQLKVLPVQGVTFELKNKAMDILMSLHGLRHENVNPLLGCLMEPTRPALVWEWCSRGSLEDVLIQDEIKLDWSFRLSLLTDLVRGLRYLHSVPHRVHGNLTSRNCVIDARWVLKLTDYCLPSFYTTQNMMPPQKTARDLLWTAPELLRSESLRFQGTQPADVYSFAIIMQEVVVRGEPFCMLALTPEEIIEKVKRPPPLIRPSVSKGAAPPEAINIMRQCWAEQPDMRPDMNAVYDLFKTLNHGRKVNFVDTMFQMLEKYSNNLEDLIRERTEQLDMEKKKTEQLLNRMLPSSVAEKLKFGMPVDPEEFSEVTIYFSDIVGFTTISAFSTPFEVVDLLNDLYTCFDATINAYNVYKVETIGDAYMVVGGLPVRIADHADQVATMALDLLHQSGQFKIRHLPFTPLRLRIGLHTGPCCAGVVGLTMPRYCLFGDTVNTASRMESTGSAWRIHISAATKEKLDAASGYQLEYRGETDIKGKGKMQTFWLLGKQGFNKELPSPPPIGLDEQLILHGRMGPAEAGTGATLNAAAESLAPHRFKSEDSTSSLEGNDLPIHRHQSSIEDKERSRKPNLIYQLSLDPGLLIDENNRSSMSEESNATYSRKRWNARRQMTFDHSTSTSYRETDDQNIVKTSDRNIPSKNISGLPDGVELSKNNSISEPKSSSGLRSGLSTPFSSSDINIDVLGVSFVNQPKISSNVNTNLGHRKMNSCGGIDVNDLSTPYNHYRCLSPSNGRNNIIGSINVPLPLRTNTNTGSKFLKRQFSMERDDILTASNETNVKTTHTTARLFKQNSAGAAHDLERIEEIPSHGVGYKHRSNLPNFSSQSASVESLN